MTQRGEPPNFARGGGAAHNRACHLCRHFRELPGRRGSLCFLYLKRGILLFDTCDSFEEPQGVVLTKTLSREEMDAVTGSRPSSTAAAGHRGREGATDAPADDERRH